VRRSVPSAQLRRTLSVISLTLRTSYLAADLDLFQKTDPSWPQFMRIHPILNWTYTDIWDYLRLHEVPWCHLYDEGCVFLGLARAVFRWTCVLTSCLPDAMARSSDSRPSARNSTPIPTLPLPCPHLHRKGRSRPPGNSRTSRSSVRVEVTRRQRASLLRARRRRWKGMIRGRGDVEQAR
jgi:3'-phosphoadenosine 5'-phosphosulfate sulfotransferase (PAPS reductase)/FAD synthetase